MKQVFLAGFALLLASNLSWAGSNWPQFRGPNGSGVTEGDKPPIRFGPGTNELFKVPVPGGLSSPCIWNDRIFLTALEDDKLVTLCYSAKNGKRLWSREAPFEKLEAVHPSDGSPAASTPATDGERVYSFFGSAGVFAYTLDGEKAWEHKLPTARHVGDFGTGTSPIVRDGIVLVNRDMLSGSHLLALRATDGTVAWRAERPEFNSSYTTPAIFERNGAREVVLAGAQRIKAYDLKTGREQWQFAGLPNAACPTPLTADGLIYFAGWSPTAQDLKLGPFEPALAKLDKNKDGTIAHDEKGEGVLQFVFPLFDQNKDNRIQRAEWDATLEQMGRAENQAFAIRPGTGAAREPEVLWKYTRGLPYVPTSLLYRGLFYMVRDGGMMTCLDARTGQPHYEQERLGALGSFYPSPVAADGRIYICSNDGKLTVLSAGEKPEVLSKTELGERCATTPALAHNKLFVRSANYLWCFGEQP